MKKRTILSLVLSVSMMLQLCLPVAAATAGDLVAAGCIHHTKHTEACGYAAGSPCGHEHSEACYEKTLSCTLTAEEAPAEGEVSPDGEAPHEHSEACYTTQAVCKHTHDAVCGYTEGVVCSFNPATCPECNPVVPETPEAPEVPEEPVVPEIPEVPETIDSFAGNHDISIGGLYLSSAHCVKGCEGHIVTGSTTNNLIMVGSGTHNITLRGVSIDKSAVSESCAFEISGGARVRLTLEGENTLKSGYYTPGLEVAAGSGLTITQESTGSLTATGGTYAAGIGGRQYSGGGTIGILGGTVTAYGGAEGAGIGGGYDGASGCYITIGGGKINATGGDYGAGIGGSYDGNGKTENYIAITGGNVTARAGAGGAIYGAAAGIGGGYKDQSTNNINISGGTVDAIGGAGWGATGGGGAGIGGGQSQDGGNIRISGGAISAKGGYECAGIGGGESGAGGDIHISGGTITAYGGSDGAGIGSGYRGDGGSITINGDAFIFATKGKDGNHDIGLGRYGDEGSVTRARGIVFEGGATQGTLYGSITLPANFTVPLGTVLCIPVGNTLTVPDGITLTLDGYLSVLGTLTEQSGSTILNRENIVDRFMSMVSAGNVVINSCGTSCSGHILAGTTIQNTVTVTGGTHDIWLYSVNIQIRSNSKDVSSFALSGDANVRLTLSGSNTLKSGAADYAGLQVPLGTTLTILKASTGRLDATGTSNAAGIGGSEKVDAGTIVIQGGTITANGGRYGAGIGDGHRFAGSKIEIQGGTVIANGGQYGAGIGSGGAALMEGGDGGCNVTISGGKIIATGGDYCAGIGGTRNNSSGKTNNITITGGDVTAKAGAGGLNYGSAAGIGGGHGDWAVNNINITGGTISATGGSGWGASGGGGAGIGGGQSQSGGTINLSNAVITAQGGRWGAGIGGGQNGAGGSINITGGTITATGGENAAGIGGGQNGGGGTVKFDENTVVFATRGGTDAAHIGAGAKGTGGTTHRNSGIIFEGDSGAFYGSNVTLKADATLTDWRNLTIGSGKTLVIPAGRTFTNNGSLTLKGGKVTDAGTFTNNGNLYLETGEITGTGTLNGSGSFKAAVRSEDIGDILPIVYTGKEIRPTLTVAPSRTIMDKSFEVTTEGFTLVYKNNIEAGKAMAAYTKTDLLAEKPFDILRSDIAFEGGAKTYNKDGVEINAFTYGDTITVTATPKMTGVPPSKLAAAIAAPSANQMALYLGDKQISDPVGPDSKGLYTITCKAAGTGFAMGENTLTVKYVGTASTANHAENVTITLSPKPLTASPSVAGTTYNGKTDFSNVPLTLTGVEAGDTVTATAGGTAAKVDGTAVADVGNWAFTATTATLGGKDSGNYTLPIVDVSGNVNITCATATVTLTADRQETKRAAIGDHSDTILLTATAMGVNGEKPNGNVVFKQGNTILETVKTTNGVAAYPWKNPPVGALAVSAEFTATDTNYSKVVATASQSIDISKAAQTGFALTPVPVKTYGGKAFTLSTTGGSGTGTVTYAVTEGNAITITGNTANIIGAGDVTVTATKAGDGNYNEATATTDIKIAQKALTVMVYPVSKVYDGTRDTTATYSILGKVGADDVAATGSGITFNTKDVGTDKGITAKGVFLSGAQKSNYMIFGEAIMKMASITPKPLSWATGGTVSPKTYDGGTAATVEKLPTLSGVIAGDVVTVIPGTVTFASANVGSHAITASGFGLEGTDAGNYKITVQPPFAKGSITAATSEATVTVGGSYTYTGGQIQPAAEQITVKIGEAVIPAESYTVSYGENINVLSGGTVTVTLKGSYSGTATGSFPIVKATTSNKVIAEPILLTEGVEKAYSIPLPTSLDGVGALTYGEVKVSGDIAFAGDKKPTVDNTKKTLEFSTAAENTANQKGTVIVTVSTANYKDFTFTLNLQTTAKEGVTLLGLTAAENSVYNGTAQKGFEGTVAATDGAGKTVEIKTLSYSYTGISGTDYVTSSTPPTKAGSYNLVVSVDKSDETYTGNHSVISFTIAKAPLTVTAGSYTVTKTWDGSTSAGTGKGTLTVSGAVNGDTVTATATPGAYSGSDVGDNYDVVLTPVLSDHDNYTLSRATITIKGSITKADTYEKISAPGATPEAVGKESITLQRVTVDGETVEYAKSITNAAPNDGWQDSPEFAGLTPVTEYSFFARVKENDNHGAGTPSDGTAITSGKKNPPEIQSKSMVFPVGQVWESDFTVAELLSEWAFLEGSPLPEDAMFSGISGPEGDARKVLDSIDIKDNKLVFKSKNLTEANLEDVFLITVSFNAYQDVTFPMSFASSEKFPAIISAAIDSKVYDGKAMAEPKPSATADGSDITLTYEYKWMQGANELTDAPKDAGDYQLVITGSDDSYLSTLELSFTISAKEVTVEAGGYKVEKIWDGNATVGTASGTPAVSGILEQDLGVTVSAVPRAYSAGNAGKYDVLVDLSLNGNTLGNYVLKSGTVTVPGIIWKKAQNPLRLASPGNKVYGDGPFQLSATGGTGSGAVSYAVTEGNAITISGSTATIVGIGKVTLRATKESDGNYGEISSEKITITVAPKPVTVTMSAQSKVYDGTNKAAVTYTVVGKVTGDDVTAGARAIFSSKYVGTDKTVTSDDITLSGAKAGHYSLTVTTVTTKASITQKPLVWGTTGTVSTKTYDGNTAAVVATLPTLSGVIFPETVTVKAGTVAFASADAGTHSVTATGFGMEGTHAANYSVAGQPSFASGTITAKTGEPTVVVSGTHTFTGKQIQPAVTVKVDSKEILSTDYTVSYDENINVTTGGSVTVTLKGNYSGSKTQTFPILKATTNTVAPDPILMTEKLVKDYSIPLPAGIGNAGAVSYSVGAPTNASIFSKVPQMNTTAKTLEFSSASAATVGEEAAVVITIRSDNYKDFTVTMTFGITAKRSVTLMGLEAANGTYSGEPQNGYSGELLVDGQPITQAQIDTLLFSYIGINGTKYDASSTPPTKAGSYKLVVAVNDTNVDYTGRHVDIPFTIAPKTVTVTAENYTVTKTWDGSTKAGDAFGTLTVTGTVNDETVTATAIPGDYPNSDADSYPLTANLTLEGEDSGNYALKSPTLTLTGRIGRASSYAGAPLEATLVAAGATTISLKSIAVDKETVEYGMSTTSVAPTGGWQNSPTLTGLIPATQYYFFARVQGNSNHGAGTTGTGTAIRTVKAVHAPVTVPDILILNGEVRSGTVTLKGVFGENSIPEGAAFGIPEGTPTVLQSLSRADSTTLSYASHRNAVGTASADVFTVPITSTRYEDITLTITFPTTDKVAATITAALDGKTYDGKALAKPTPTATVDGKSVTLDYTFQWKQGGSDLPGDPKNAGEYRLLITGSSDSYLGSVTIPVTIAQKDLTITAESRSIFAGADAAFTHAVSGLVNGETVDGLSYDCAYVKEVGMAGNYPITPFDARISGGSENYAINYVSGTLTVTVDTKALDTAIADAKATKSGVISSDLDASQVQNGTRFVSTEVMTAFDAALASAEQTKAGATTKGEITAAAAALKEATTTFAAAIRTGTYSSGGGWTPPNPVEPEKPVVPEKPSADKFADIEGHWAEESIRFVVAEGLFSGTGETTFAPDRSMDRAMFATVLGRMAKADVSKYAAPNFADVAPTAYYAGSVAWAAEQGIVTGTGEDSFSPERPISRQELVVMLHRYAKLAGMDVSIGENTNILSYDDAFDINSWAIPAMQWACGAGVLQGADSSLLPNKTATRAEVATILQRFVALTADADKLK